MPERDQQATPKLSFDAMKGEARELRQMHARNEQRSKEAQQDELSRPEPTRISGLVRAPTQKSGCAERTKNEERAGRGKNAKHKNQGLVMPTPMPMGHMRGSCLLLSNSCIIRFFLVF